MGAGAYVPISMKKRLWVKVQRDSPAVSRFLKDTFFITINERDQLLGLKTVDKPELAQAENESLWCKQYETPGFKGLIARSMQDIIREPDTSSDCSRTFIKFDD